MEKWNLKIILGTISIQTLQTHYGSPLSLQWCLSWDLFSWSTAKQWTTSTIYIYIGMFSISMVCSWKLHGMAILLYNNLLMFSLKLGYSYVWVCTRYYTVKCFSIGNLRSKAFCQKFYQRLWHIFKSYKMAGLYMNCWDNIFSWILNFTKNFVKMISPNCPEI